MDNTSMKLVGQEPKNNTKNENKGKANKGKQRPTKGKQRQNTDKVKTKKSGIQRTCDILIKRNIETIHF